MITIEDYKKRFDTLEKMFGAEYLGELFKHIDKTYDALERLEGGQFHYFMDFMIAESERTERFAGHKTLVNDTLGYDCVRVLAVLKHHCQLCAEDPEAWHTRSGFCPHK